jgi:ubiquinone/menaquinone biosynthesis C-methylase UbiE
MTLESFKNFAEKNEDVKTLLEFSNAEGNSGDIAEILCKLHPEIFKNQAEISRLIPTGFENIKNAITPFQFVYDAISLYKLPDEKLDLIRPQLNKMVFNVIKKSYEVEFNKNPEETLEKLEKLSSEIKVKELSEVINKIHSYYKEVKDFKIPQNENQTEKKMTPFQRLGIHFLVNEKKALLGDTPGMFKTSQAIYANNVIREKSKGKSPTLIICPNSVKSHWVREIEQFAYPQGQKVVDFSAKNFKESIKNSKNADWVIIHYALLNKLGKTKEFNTNFKHVIIDEVHNAKNEKTLRTKIVKKIADKSEYLSLLSGTPIPNTISDLYMLMSLLDKETYPPTTDAKKDFMRIYLKNPQVVKELLHNKMLRRKSEDYIPDTPTLETRRINIPLKNKQLEVYDSIRNKDLPLGKKITEMLKASINPKKVDQKLLDNPNILKNIKPTKLEKLDEIIQKETKLNKKIIIFTHLKTGVVDNLLQRYKKYDPLAITGDVPTENTENAKPGKREKIRRAFQKYKNHKILIATSTMNEGVDLSSAGVVVNYTVPWTPAEYEQRIKRTQRLGEIKKHKVLVYNLITTTPTGSIEDAMLNSLQSKNLLINYMLSGVHLSKEELNHYNSKKERIVGRQIETVNQKTLRFFRSLRASPTERTDKILKAHEQEAREVAQLYPQSDMAENTAKLYLKEIKRLENQGLKFKNKLDLAGGPGTLSYFNKKPSIVIDISREMLKKGKELNPKSHFIQASTSNIPLKDNYADLINFSQALQYISPNERPKTLQEISRVLKKEGVAIITLPSNYTNEKEKNNLLKTLKNNYGFKILKNENKLGSSKNIRLISIQKKTEAKKTNKPITFQSDKQYQKTKLQTNLKKIKT